MTSPNTTYGSSLYWVHSPFRQKLNREPKNSALAKYSVFGKQYGLRPEIEEACTEKMARRIKCY